MNRLYVLLTSLVVLSSCSMQHVVQQKAKRHLINDPALANAHVGIAVHDPAKKKYVYQYQSDKLFLPASNIKIVTTFAALKYLPEYLPSAEWIELDTAILIKPMGDPSFLHTEFKTHPLFDKMKAASKPLYMSNINWNTTALGSGWSTDDYNEGYQVERSAFPIYGNKIQWFQEKSTKENPTNPQDTIDVFIYSNPDINWPVSFGKSTASFYVKRDEHSNSFTLSEGKEKTAMQNVPFITYGIKSALTLIKDSLGKEIFVAGSELLQEAQYKSGSVISSQSRDTILKKMMHRSDNFYADQSLLMASQLVLKKMDESAIIDYVLKNDLRQLPVAPKWVDGSGLSRYNQFSPTDMIVILDQLKSQFEWEKIKTIFPGVGQGTLRSFAESSAAVIYAKTGSMGGVYCLSGYVKNKKDKWLTFSIMVNNHNSNLATVRKKVESFLQTL